MHKINCPLCQTLIENYSQKIDTKDLEYLYRKSYGLDIKRLGNVAEIMYYQCPECLLMFFYPSILGDEIFYADLQLTELYYKKQKPEYLFAKQFIDSGTKVLEIGCGEGYFYNYLDNVEYVGLELNNKAVDIALRKNIDVINESIYKFSSKNRDRFDVVCTFQVLEHISISELSQFLFSAVSCLKEGGKLIISVPNDDSYPGYIENLTLNLPPHHQSRWSYNTLKVLGDIFESELIDIYYDPIEDEKIELSYVIELKKKLKKSVNVVDNTIKTRVINYALKRIVRICGQNIFSKIINVQRFKGHSITAIYKKVK